MAYTSRDMLIQIYDETTNSLGAHVAQLPYDKEASGTIDATGETITIDLGNGCATVALQITGTWTGQLDFQGTVDGTNYAPIEASNGTATVNATAGNDIYLLPGSGYHSIRIYGTLITVGAAIVSLRASTGTTSSILTGALPAGTNMLGATKDAGPNWTSVMGGASQVCFTSADATANPALIANDAAFKIVVTDLIISVDTAMSLTFSEETAGTVFLKMYMAANSTIQYTPRSKFKLNTAAKDLLVDASVAGNIAIQYHYYLEA